MFNYRMKLLKHIFIFVLTASFLFYEMAVQVSPGIMTHQLMRDLGISAYGLGIMSGFYFYTYTLMQIPAGLIFDRFHVRHVIVLPLLVCALGAYLFSLTLDIYLGSFARLAMGAGSAFAFIGVLVVAGDIFPKRYFGMLAGCTQLLAAFGAIAGQMPLVTLIQEHGWRNAMDLLSLIGLCLAAMIWVFVRYKADPATYPDRQFTLRESFTHIARNPQTWVTALYAFCMWAPMAGFASLWGVPFLESRFHLTPTAAAEANACMWLGIAIGSPIIGFVSDAIRKRRVLLFCCALVGLVSFSCLLLIPHLALPAIASLLLVAGAACAGQALSFAVVRENNCDENLAAAIGFNNMAVVISGAVFQPLIGKLITWHNFSRDVSQYHYQPSDYWLGLVIIIAAYAVATLTTLLLLREPLQETVSSQNQTREQHPC